MFKKYTVKGEAMYRLKETLQDKQQHLRCLNYNGNHEKALIRLLNMQNGYSFEREVAEPEVVIVSEGILEIEPDGMEPFAVSSGKMFFLPPGRRISVSAVKDAAVVILHLDVTEQHCARLGFSQLELWKPQIKNDFNILPVRSCIRIFLDGMIPFVQDGFLCSNYLKAKITEFVHILKNYYRPVEQAAFFYPLLGGDLIFSYFVSKHIRQVKTVEELAAIDNMSRSGFIDKFKRKMGQSPAAYIKKRRLELIKADLLDPAIPLKEVATRNGYDHYEVFSRLCKKNLGLSPSEIRDKAK